jgi:hypothetical protein
MLVAAQVSSMKTSCSGFSSGCCAPGAPCRGDVGPILLGGVPGLFFSRQPAGGKEAADCGWADLDGLGRQAGLQLGDGEGDGATD